ncbi:MAG: EcsC family protein [Flavipsychrobacter sp.]|nr:EcsC family protein [Flavipsychrobacter sp.]
MQTYNERAIIEMMDWQKEMKRKSSISAYIAAKFQSKFNSLVPEKVHQVITAAFRHTVQGLLKGSELVSAAPLKNTNLEDRERRIEGRIEFYKNTAAAEGALTGAGGFLWSLADFPMWLTLKMKMLTEIAALYGFDISDYKERVYILYTFQLAFSTRQHRREIFGIVANWQHTSQSLPAPNDFNWRKFQQEYRDYIDLAKLIQLIPGIGAIAGAYVNHKYTKLLGHTAMNAYRTRLFTEGKLNE